MNDIAICIAYLLSALVLASVGLRDLAAARIRRLARFGPSESQAHIFCCCSIAAAYAFHALS